MGPLEQSLIQAAAARRARLFGVPQKAKTPSEEHLLIGARAAIESAARLKAMQEAQRQAEPPTPTLPPTPPLREMPILWPRHWYLVDRLNIRAWPNADAAEYVSRKEPKIAKIIATVCRYYDISLSDVMSNRRTGPIVLPRQVAMYLAKTMTRRSLPEIGLRMGRDHTTVLHALRKIERMRATDKGFALDIEAIIFKVMH